MNTPALYARRDDRRLEEPSTTTTAPAGVPAPTVHRDPSIPVAAPGGEPDRLSPTVAWVRPSELPTLIGAPWVRRGIDLESELVRRSRRAPINAARAGRRVTRPATARLEPVAPTTTERGLEP